MPALQNPRRYIAQGERAASDQHVRSVPAPHTDWPNRLMAWMLMKCVKSGRKTIEAVRLKKMWTTRVMTLKQKKQQKTLESRTPTHRFPM